VECYTRIPKSRRPIAVEDDQAGDERSYPVSPLLTPGGWLSQVMREPKPLPTIWRLSFSRRPILRFRQILTLLTWG
jgi:hypothetical protein